jgi:hypothetical protein
LVYPAHQSHLCALLCDVLLVDANLASRISTTPRQHLLGHAVCVLNPLIRYCIERDTQSAISQTHLSALSRLTVTSTSTPSTHIFSVTSGSPHVYDSASYTGRSVTTTTCKEQTIRSRTSPGCSLRVRISPSLSGECGREE